MTNDGDGETSNDDQCDGTTDHERLSADDARVYGAARSGAGERYGVYGKTDAIGGFGDPLGKDRSHIHGQLAGWRESGVRLEKGINNRLWAQPERPRGNGEEAADNAGFRVLSGQNAIMLHHISAGRPFDVQASNVGVYTPGTPGNPQPFHKSRLGVRPGNIYMPNYSAETFDFGVDWRPLLDTRTVGDATVGHDGRSGSLALRVTGYEDRAILQTPGPVGQLDHHLHGYADVELGDLAGKQFAFGAWVDADNHALLGFDATATSPGGIDRPLTVTVVSGGTTLVDRAVDRFASPGRSGWLCYVRDGYQAFFERYSIEDNEGEPAMEFEQDLSGWPGEPKLRVELTRSGTGERTVNVHALEYGLAKKREQAGSRRS